MAAAGLKIRMTKRRGKPALPICERADGSTTMAEMAPGPVHDLAHYAVETTPGLERAFYGLLAGGMNIQSFDVQAATTRIDIPREAVLVEHIVNLLQTEMLSGRPWPDFNEELRKPVTSGRQPTEAPDPLDEADVASIRVLRAELIHRWHSLAAGGTIELLFPRA